MGMGAGTGGDSGVAKLVGSSVAGVSELFLFHPVDTVAKRLMSNQNRFFEKGDGLKQLSGKVNTIIFKEHASSGFFAKYRSLFPGLHFAAGYKVLQRVWKFGGQPIVNEALQKRYKQNLTDKFGEKTARTLISAISGSMVGIGEVVLLPLDVLKIKSQTNPETLRGRGVIDMFMTEGRGLYRGAWWTIARNAPGSFALFGANAFVMDTIFRLENYKDASLLQTFVSSTAGAVASIVVAAPMDTIKTRIQNRPFDAPESGFSIVRNLVRNEGAGAFFKGLTPKIIVVGPKLIFSFTVAQYLIAYTQSRLS